MNLTRIISENSIFLDVNAKSSSSLLKEISNKCSDVTKIPSNIILKKLNEREKLGSTFVGNGICIPHAKINGLKKIFSFFFRLKKSIIFTNTGTEKVDLIFVIIAPFESNSEHLMALSAISSFLKQIGNKELLRDTKEKKKIYGLFKNFSED